MTKFTVALIIYKRPDYTRRVMAALSSCIEFSNCVENVVVSIDDAHGKGLAVRDLTNEWFGILDDLHVPHQTLLQPRSRGIVGNSVLGIKGAFDSGAKNVLYVEDDALLSPDALQLASWMVEQDREKYVACGLSRGKRPMESKDPSYLSESNVHPCPYSWTIAIEQWPVILKHWCDKHHHPVGWSFALTYHARLRSAAYFLAPNLARVYNIGREDGTNGDKFHWDEALKDIPYSLGDHQGNYEVVHHIDQAEASAVESWMVSEIEQTPAKKYDGWLGFGRPEELGHA